MAFYNTQDDTNVLSYYRKEEKGFRQKGKDGETKEDWEEKENRALTHSMEHE